MGSLWLYSSLSDRLRSETGLDLSLVGGRVYRRFISWGNDGTDWSMSENKDLYKRWRLEVGK